MCPGAAMQDEVQQSLKILQFLVDFRGKNSVMYSLQMDKLSFCGLAWNPNVHTLN